MALISIEPGEVGLTGLIWLLLTYGYILYFASGMIGDGSELLLLVPSMAGLVGGVVLPLLGAVPDGAIILFSGLGDIEEAQETLSVGVGALAGSTIMLLTVPFFLSVYAGRVDLDDSGRPLYSKKPKLTPGKSFCEDMKKSGVGISEAVQESGKTMMLTIIPYLLIQGPAFFIHGPTEQVAEGEKWYALAALIVCLIGLIYYMRLQLNISQQGLDKEKRIAVMKKKLLEGRVSLAAAIAPLQDEATRRASQGGYQAISGDEQVPEELKGYLKEILKEPYTKYDVNGDGTLDKKEAFVLFRDFHESINSEEFDELFRKFDKSQDDEIDFDEFMTLAYVLILQTDRFVTSGVAREHGSVIAGVAQNVAADDEDEEEDLPEELTDLPPDKQQAAIKKKAFSMLFVGTVLVVLFSDPMVDVLQELADRAHIPAFYVAFVLAPLASNATEVIASQYYAAKKTRKTITVGLGALEGAAAMNNTFCLAIFMGLVFFRGLAWQYTAETIAIILTELIVGYLVLKDDVMTVSSGLIIGLTFPLSLVFVAVLENFGVD